MLIRYIKNVSKVILIWFEVLNIQNFVFIKIMVFWSNFNKQYKKLIQIIFFNFRIMG